MYFVPHPLRPANTGARLRNYHLARQLAALASVTFVEMCSVDEEDSTPPADSLLAGVVTLHKNRTYSAFNIVRGLMWRYSRTSPNPIKQVVARRIASLMERAEERLLVSYGSHIVTSERDRQELLARQPGANIRVIPNGVDTAFYAAKNADAQRQHDLRQAKPTILCVESINYHANIDAVSWFTRVMWPEIARANPDLQFTIVGRNPPPQVRALASNRVHVTGTVDDVRGFYSSALLAVVPLRSGGGTRLKILEAMAAGVPVVSTKLGAEGLDVEHDKNILLADDPPEIVAAVNRLVSSAETRKKLSETGRALVASVYAWATIGKQLFGLHEKLVKTHSDLRPRRRRNLYHQGHPRPRNAD
jgi:polysaccharide biosynthesis protein PslH